MSHRELDILGQRSLLGNGALDRLPHEVEEAGWERAFLIVSQSVAANTPIVSALEQGLKGRLKGMHIGIGAHTPESDVDDAEQGVLTEDEMPDVLLSLGGGAVIDGTKHVLHRLTNGFEDLEGAPQHVAIPTTLSGAEFTHLAGITIDGAKTGFGDMGARSDLCILDPTVVSFTPRALWAGTGVRCLDHAIEGYLQTTDADLEPKLLRAMELLTTALPKAIEDAYDTRAATDCLEGSALASLGTLEANAGRGPSHVIGKALGATYGIQHGTCSVLTMPLVLDWQADQHPEKVGRIAKVLGAEREDPKLAEHAMIQWMEHLGIPRPPLRELGVPKEELDQVRERLLGPVDEALLARVEELW